MPLEELKATHVEFSTDVALGKYSTVLLLNARGNRGKDEEETHKLRDHEMHISHYIGII